jgi:hypothetical protein
MLKKPSIKTIAEYLSVLFIAFLIFSPILYFYLYHYGISDISLHTEYARAIFEAQNKVPKEVVKVVVAHSAWHWAVIDTHEILGNFLEKSWKFSAFIVTMGSELLTVGILYCLLRKKLKPFSSGALSISVMIIAPVLLFIVQDNTLILGYISTTSWSSPTDFFVKPFAILQLYLSAEALLGKDSGWKRILFATLVSIIAVFAKPSYIICLLPSLGILALLSIWRKKSVDWKMLLLGIGLPSVAILVWQYVTYYGAGEGTSIIFAPFVVMSHYSPNLPLKFFLSIVFPLIITAVCWKEAIKDSRIQLGWIGFGMGAIYTYLFAESGWGLYSGNFVKCGEISLFILFVSCILFLSEKNLHGNNRISSGFIFSAGALHIIFGIYNYLFSLTTKPPPF